MGNEQQIFEEARKSIIAYDVEKAEEIARRGLEIGVNPVAMIQRGFIPGITEVGDNFGRQEMFLPELILAGDAMKAAVAICEAAFPKEETAVKTKVVMGAVEGDMHDIGKSIVVSFLVANGFEVYDLGRDVPADRFVEKAREVGANVVGSSALLTTTLEEQRKIVEALKEAGLREKVKIIVGGAPCSQKWAERIGADAYAENAVEAVAKVKQLVGLT